ncbi:MAG: rRNA maturation RNase YbeY [Halieaceae bacterium]|jgi:probable rRNA maturation factor|nr:rRNA maturation RNase YbeY [Halieaceae bacterium]
MNLQLDIQKCSAQPTPTNDEILCWVNAALVDRQRDTEISVRLVDREEMARLNEAYRGKPGSTNVLSFPSNLPRELALPLLGDIVICVPVVHQEAADQCKSPSAHWAHMTVHGILHLLGYDHLSDEEAQTMESLETEILASLDYPCPYKVHNPGETTPK